MLIQGTHDEIVYFNMMCQRLPNCKGCPLAKWCSRREPNKDTISSLVIKDTGKKCGPGYHTILIRKENNEKP